MKCAAIYGLVAAMLRSTSAQCNVANSVPGFTLIATDKKCAVRVIKSDFCDFFSPPFFMFIGGRVDWIYSCPSLKYTNVSVRLGTHVYLETNSAIVYKYILHITHILTYKNILYIYITSPYLLQSNQGFTSTGNADSHSGAQTMFNIGNPGQRQTTYAHGQ